MTSQSNQQNHSQNNSNVHINILTPPSTADDLVHVPHQQQPVIEHTIDHNGNLSRSSTAPFPRSSSSMFSISSASASSSSSSSSGSTDSQTRREDVIFDQIEDLLCEYMRDPSRHCIHYRLLRWSLDDNLSQVYSAFVLINPPMTKGAIAP